MHRAEIVQKRVADINRLGIHDRIALAVSGHPRARIPVLILVFLELVDRERVLHVLHQDIARGDIDVLEGLVFIEPRDSPGRRRFIGVDDLHDRRKAVFQVFLDRLEHRRHLHRGQHLAEEPLVSAPERAEGRAALIAATLRVIPDDLIDVRKHALPSLRSVVVHHALDVGQLVLDLGVFHAFVGQVPGHVDAHLLHVPSNHFHGRDPAGIDLLNERANIRKGRAFPPEPQSIGVCKVRDLCGCRCRRIDHARVR